MKDFITKFIIAIDSISPLKQVRVKTNTKPWFDGNILEAIRVRDKLRKNTKSRVCKLTLTCLKMLKNMPSNLLKRKSVLMSRINSEQILLNHLNFGKSSSPLAFLQMPIILLRYALRTKIMLSIWAQRDKQYLQRFLWKSCSIFGG